MSCSLFRSVSVPTEVRFGTYISPFWSVSVPIEVRFGIFVGPFRSVSVSRDTPAVVAWSVDSFIRKLAQYCKYCYSNVISFRLLLRRTDNSCRQPCNCRIHRSKLWKIDQFEIIAMQNLARWRSLTFVFNNSKWRPAKLCLRLRSISRPQHLIRKL